MTVVEKDLLDLNVDKIRSEIPSLKDVIFFNSGWTGPTPKVVLEVINKSLEKQVKLIPSSREAVKSQVEELIEAKSKIASFFSTSSKNICLTANTTLGINLALSAYNWSNNDEIITTKDDHASVIIPLYNLKERYNLKIKLIDIDFNNPIESFKRNITKNTKVAIFCHVFWTNGNALALKEIIQEMRNNKIISIIDGAQSAGAININLDNLNPDFYSVPGQKWLLGPVGTGFLYINKDLLDKRPPWPSIVGFESASDAGEDSRYDLNFRWSPKKDAGMFEFGGMNSSLFNGLASAINFATQNISKFDIYKRIHLLAEYLISKLKENPSFKVVTLNPHAGLVSWQHKKLSSYETVTKLWKEKRILIREIPNFNFCRASLHYFNTREEVDLLAEQLQKL